MKLLAVIGLIVASATSVAQPASSAGTVSKDAPVRIEAIPIQTLTISNKQFLKGDARGRPTTIAGVLRVAQGSGRLPLVVLVPESGGINKGADVWDRQFEAMGISTFMLDSFAGQGIVGTTVDQSLFAPLNGILDLYRVLKVLVGHPRVDPTRIAVMGFSRGARTTLYSILVLKKIPAHAATKKPFIHTDNCVGRNPHVAYSASSTHATEEAVKSLLKTVFKLD